MPKYTVAQFRDLAGPTNPNGILSPAFLMLKQALDTGDRPENVVQALYDWIGQRPAGNTKLASLEKLLDLSPDEALDGIIQLIGGGMNREHLPPVVVNTLRRALGTIAASHIRDKSREIEREQDRLSQMRAKFGVESAERIVADLLS